MKKFLVLALLLIATSAHARYVSVDFAPSAGAEYYTFHWGTASGVYDYSYDLIPDDGTATKWVNTTTYSAGDRAYFWDYIWVANQTTTGNTPSTRSTYWDGPYYPYFTATSTTGPLPIEDKTVYAAITATNANAKESTYSSEKVFYYLVQDGYPTPEQIAVFLREDISGWVDASPSTPTYDTASRFTVVGDDRRKYPPGQKLKINDSGGYVYSSVARRVYSAGVTTVYLTSSVLTGGSISEVFHSNWSSTATATMRYRKAGEIDWTIGHDLYHIDASAPQTGWTWTIFDLDQGTDYVVEVTVHDVGKDDVIYTKLMSTASLPAESEIANIIIPAETSVGYIGEVNTTTYINTVFATAVAGDVIEFENGTYHVDGLIYDNRDGTEASPIYVRGESRSGVILHDTTLNVLHIKNSQHVVFENFTIQGSGVDWGCAGYNGVTGIIIWSSEGPLIIRNLNITGTDLGIVGSSAIRQTFIYNNVLEGNNTWTQDLWGLVDGCWGGPDGDHDIDGNQSSMWNDYGIQTKGNSNAVFNNTVSGFGDSIKLSGNASTNYSNFGYRNKILMSGDDSCELDEGVRNIAWYDNYIANSGGMASFQPINNGPVMAFRNLGVNISRSNVFKMNGAKNGIFIYNNTIVRTANPNAGLAGNINHLWIQFNNGITQNWGFENNIFIRQNYTGGYTLNHAASGNVVDATHNSWYPDGEFKWEHLERPYRSLANQQASTLMTTNIFAARPRHYADVIEDAQPFATAITLPVDTHTEVITEYTGILAPTAKSKNTGVAIAGITDGYTGAAPDRGAIISGRTVPTYGATYVYSGGDPDPDPSPPSK